MTAMPPPYFPLSLHCKHCPPVVHTQVGLPRSTTPLAEASLHLQQGWQQQALQHHRQHHQQHILRPRSPPRSPQHPPLQNRSPPITQGVSAPATSSPQAASVHKQQAGRALQQAQAPQQHTPHPTVDSHWPWPQMHPGTAASLHPSSPAPMPLQGPGHAARAAHVTMQHTAGSVPLQDRQAHRQAVLPVATQPMLGPTWGPRALLLLSEAEVPGFLAALQQPMGSGGSGGQAVLKGSAQQQQQQWQQQDSIKLAVALRRLVWVAAPPASSPLVSKVR